VLASSPELDLGNFVLDIVKGPDTGGRESTMGDVLL